MGAHGDEPGQVLSGLDVGLPPIYVGRTIDRELFDRIEMHLPITAVPNLVWARQLALLLRILLLRIRLTKHGL